MQDLEFDLAFFFFLSSSAAPSFVGSVGSSGIVPGLSKGVTSGTFSWTAKFLFCLWSFNTFTTSKCFLRNALSSAVFPAYANWEEVSRMINGGLRSAPGGRSRYFFLKAVLDVFNFWTLIWCKGILIFELALRHQHRNILLSETLFSWKVNLKTFQRVCLKINLFIGKHICPSLVLFHQILISICLALHNKSQRKHY